jgi:hypothetical protein
MPNVWELQSKVGSIAQRRLAMSCALDVNLLNEFYMLLID